VVEGELAIEFVVVERRTTRFGLIVGVFAIVELAVECRTTRFDLVVGVFAIVELAVERASWFVGVFGIVELAVERRTTRFGQVVGVFAIVELVERVERTIASSRFLVFVDRILGCMIAIDLVEHQHLAYRARRKPCWHHPKRYHLGMIRRTYVHRRT